MPSGIRLPMACAVARFALISISFVPYRAGRCDVIEAEILLDSPTICPSM